MKKLSRIMFCIILAVGLSVSSMGIAEENNSRLTMDGFEQVPAKLMVAGHEVETTIALRKTGTALDNGEPVETFTADVSVDFGFNKDGEIVPVSRIQPKGSMTDSSTYVSSAFRWNGTLSYSRKTINNQTCYKPTKYSHKITVLDSQFSLTGLNLHGGAVGFAYNSDGTNRGMRSTGDRAKSVSSPTSGASYSNSYSTSYYFISTSGTKINTYGTFKYKRRLASGGYSQVYTSPEFDVTLLDK